jgi:hypothetical protein
MAGVTDWKVCGQGRNITSYGGTVNWLYPERITVADLNYSYASLSAGAISRALWADSFPAFGLPAHSEIVGIEVQAQVSAQYANRILDSEVKLLKFEGGNQQPVGSNRAKSDYWAADTLPRTWGGSTDTWGLTAQQLETLFYVQSDFGLHLKVTAQGGSSQAKVDAVRARLYWRYKKPAVTSVSASSPNASTLSLTASTQNRVTKTKWWFKHSSASSYTYLGEVTGTSITISNLVGGSSYIVQCQALNEDQASDVFTTTTLTTSGAAPTVQVTETRSSQVTLQASATGMVNQYRWWYKKQGTSTWTDAGTTSEAIKTLIGLQVLTAYDFRVQPISDEASGRVGNYATAQATTRGIPNPPTGVTATPASDVAIAVSCNADPDATLYRFERRQEWAEWTEFAVSTAPSATATNLLRNTRYEFRVRSENDAGLSDYSAIVSAYTKYSVSGTVIDDANTPVANATAIVFDWDEFRAATTALAPQGKAISSGTGAFSIVLPGDGRKRVLVLMHQGYHGRLYVGAVGPGSYSLGRAATPIRRFGVPYAIEPVSTPFPPEDVQMVASAFGELTLTWKRTTPTIVEQQIQLATTPTFTNPLEFVVGGAVQRAIISNLEQGQKYYCRIRGRITDTWSDWSAVAEAWTTQLGESYIAELALGGDELWSFTEIGDGLFAGLELDARTIIAQWNDSYEMLYGSVEMGFEDFRLRENIVFPFPAPEKPHRIPGEIVITVNDEGRLT